MADKEVIIIGGGPSGICTAVQLQRQLGHQRFHIYERSKGLGGVWFNNTYPGCAVDIPAHYYSFSFALKPDWDKLYPNQQALFSYLQDICEEYDIHRRSTTNVECISQVWDDVRSVWTVTFRQTDDHSVTFTREAAAVVNAVGKLDLPAIPHIKGQDTFEGKQFHSARWEHSVKTEGKNVIVLGNGASATQFVPLVAEKAKHLTQFVRSAHYIQERHNPEFSPTFKWVMKNIPFACRLYRWSWAIEYDLGFAAFFMTPDGEKKRKAVAQETWDYIDRAAPKKYKEVLSPDYLVGCRRRVHSNNYLESLHRSNLSLEKDNVVEVTPRSVKTESGKEYPADVIVYASGFRTQDWLYPMEIKGRGGRDLHEHWESRGAVQAYYGTMCDQFPNWFTLYGPNTASGHNSVIYVTECQVEFLCKLLKPVLKGGAKTVMPRAEAQVSLNKSLQARLPGLTFNSGCTSWYLDKNGHNTFVWPDYAYKYWISTFNVRWSDLEVKYPRATGYLGKTVVPWKEIGWMVAAASVGSAVLTQDVVRAVVSQRLVSLVPGLKVLVSGFS